jgi:hypothetical protein
MAMLRMLWFMPGSAKKGITVRPGFKEGKAGVRKARNCFCASAY